MGAKIVRLAARYALLAIALVLLNFALPRFLPGSPLSGSGSGTDMPLPASTRDHLRGAYHLDEPLSAQFRAYLGDLVHGNLGWSISSPAPVRDLIVDRLWWTVGLVVTALIISALLGTTLGLIAGWSRGGVGDRLLLAVAGSLAALPEFLVAIGLLVGFAVSLGWFPLTGGKTLFADPGRGVLSETRDIVWHLTLPATALVLVTTSGFVLLARDTARGLQNEPWLAVARGKGLREREILRRHVLPNLALPLLTFFGLRLGAVLGGALVVERVFSLPGLGSLAFEAIQARDYPVLQALFLVSGIAMLICQFGLELLALHTARRRGASHG